MQNECIQARLDYIYISRKAEPYTFNLEIKESAIPTDYAIVSVRYAPKEALVISKGRWMMTLALLDNKMFMERVAEKGTKYQNRVMHDRIKCTDRNIINTQIHWESYKNTIRKIAKDIVKENYHKTMLHIKVIEEDLRMTNNNPEISTNGNLQAYEAYLANHLKHLKKKEVQNWKDHLSVKLANHGE